MTTQSVRPRRLQQHFGLMKVNDQEGYEDSRILAANWNSHPMGLASHSNQVNWRITCH